MLGAWRTEVDKKPATMSVDDAYKVTDTPPPKKKKRFKKNIE